MKKTALLLGVLCAVQACERKELPKAAPAPVGSSTVTSVKTLPKEIPATTKDPEAFAAYRLGEDMMDNVRHEAAREQFTKALALDPTFLSASAMLGGTTPGPDGDNMLADAIAKGTSLPEAEQVAMKVARHAHEHDSPKAAELAQRLAELVPGSWRAHFLHGRMLVVEGNLDAARLSLKKAIELEPTAAVAYNDLGCVELAQGKTDEAMMLFRKYSQMRPDEPNPQDSLAEALLVAGKVDEAEAAFQKALEIDPMFSSAWEGVGYAKLYRGDYAGAYYAFRKQREEAPSVAAKEPGYRGTALAKLAEGKAAEALKSFDAWQAEGDTAQNEEIWLLSNIDRLPVLVESGKAAEAVALVPKVLAMNDRSAAPEATQVRRRGFVLWADALANARLGKKAEADKAAATLTELFGASGDATMKGLAAFAQGEAALTRGDAKEAVAAFKNCAPNDEYCAWERSKAEDKAGDKAAATASREKLAKTQHRDPFGFYVWSRVQPKRRAS